MRYKCGDKIKVIKPYYGWEPYKAGDVFTVKYVDYDETDQEGHDLILIEENSSDDYVMFASEVELYDEDAYFAAQDADVSTWVKEEEIDEYNEIVNSLSQAIADKAKQMNVYVDGDKVAELTDTVSSSTEKIESPTSSGWAPIPPHLFGGHGKFTEGKRTRDDDDWDDMRAVGKEIIYDDYNPDSVEHPSHYTQGAVEVIDIIAQTVSGYDDGFTAHCVGTATKYLNRAPHKHETPLEDLKKAAKYLEFAIAHEEKKRI